MTESAPLEKIPAPEAFHNLQGAAFYPTPEHGAERLSPRATLAHKAKFKVSRHDRVFAIGSCFARELESALLRLRIKVLSRNLEDFSADLRNKYTTKSVVQDLEWAFEGVSDEALKATYAEEPGTALYANYNCGAGHAKRPSEIDQVLRAHRAFLTQLGEARDAELIVLTLGLAEAWYDRRSATYTNVAPSKKVVAADPDRYELHVLSYEQVLSDVERTYDLLRKHARVPQNVLLTVSPVPLAATFRSQDVLEANAYSKAVLRTAAESFVRTNSQVAYFPSYEMVSLSDREQAFMGPGIGGKLDFRHVNRAMVDHIMSSFIDAYFAPADIDAMHQVPPLERVQKLIKAKEFDKVIAMYEPIESFDFRDLYMPYYAGIAFYSTGSTERGEQCLQRALSIRGSKHAWANIHMARVQVILGRPDRAREYAERALKIEPENKAARTLLDEL